MPVVYRHPSDDRDGNAASYFVFTSPEAIFDGSTGTNFTAITDGTSNTILTVEAKRETPWTKPEEIPFNPDQPLGELGGFSPQGWNVGLADGSVRFMSKAIDHVLLQAMITKAGGEVTQDGRAIPPTLREPSSSR